MRGVGEHGGTRAQAAGGVRPIDGIANRRPVGRVEDPAYLSYPEPSQLEARVGRAEHERRLAVAAAAIAEPIELLIHLDFGEGRALHRARGAGVALDAASRSTLDYVRREVDLVATRLRDRRRLSRLVLLGDTALHAPSELRSFLAAVVARFPPLAFAEASVDLDLRITTEPHLDALASFGFDRAWVGVEDPARYTPADTDSMARALQRARRSGFTSIGVDLSCGLAHHDADTFVAGASAAAALGFDRIAIRAAVEQPLPGIDLAARGLLVAGGYQPIGLDTFVRAQDLLAAARDAGILRRALGGYTAVGAGDVIGVGAAARSEVAGAVFQNAIDLGAYEDALADFRLATACGLVLERDDGIRRRILHDLLCHGRIDWSEIESGFGVEIADVFAEDLERLRWFAEEGLVRVTSRDVEVLPPGRLVARHIAACFDRRRDRPARGATLHFRPRH
jgi:oxygen-independent coproporphyrinogen-3 oxidase